MKKTKLYTTLLSLSFSLNAFAMGLGDMRVYSSLDQPFDAEIELMDVAGIPLSDIQAHLASVADYQRVGLERSFGLGSLAFTVEKNKQGHPVLHLRSIERISEPFLQLLIDLAWAKGQVYRQYDILLDPPDYQLLVKQKSQERTASVVRNETHEAKRLDSATKALEVYGPTTQGETIWQIAQHYKSPGIQLHQLILALVDLNPDAFAKGNLNALKVGVYLKIPSIAMADRVSAFDASREIQAHDKAWPLREPIQHVIAPPYITSETSPHDLANVSQIPTVHLRGLTSIQTYLSASQDAIPSMHPVTAPPADLTSSVVKANMDIAVQAIDSLRESNAVMNDQLHAMNAQNRALQQALNQRNAEMQQMHLQIELLMRRQGIAGQVISSDNASSHHPWLWALVLLAAAGCGLYAAWRKGGILDELQVLYQKIVSVSSRRETTGSTNPVPSAPKPEDNDREVVSEPLVATPIIETEVEPTVADSTQDTAIHTETLTRPSSEPIETLIHDEPKDNWIEFDVTPPPTPQKKIKPVKHKAALDTLLELAQTYLDMGNMDAAKESLQEVLEHGNKQQKMAAKKLLDGSSH